jgi:heparan-alpha-glucosaminide N-acetyltransferase
MADDDGGSEGGELSVSVVECGARLGIDAAEVQIDLPSSYSLYVTNHECYRCADTLVTSGGSGTICAQFFTPHEWTLKLFNGGAEVDSEHYTFGEHGRYVVNATASTSDMSVYETDSPKESDRAIWIAFICIFFATLAWTLVLQYGVPPLKQAVVNCIYGKEDYFSEDVTRVGNKTGNYDSKTNVLGGESTLRRNLLDNKGTGTADASPAKKERLVSLDTFRGITLSMMIFVNYGGGGYWFFEHADWNGLTVADLLFPWFIFMMGVSMYLSFRSLKKQGLGRADLWTKVAIRTAKLFGIGLFLNNGSHLEGWRIPGVLQYFAVAYFVTSVTVFTCEDWVDANIAAIKKEAIDTDEEAFVDNKYDSSENTNTKTDTLMKLLPGDRCMLAYWPEVLIQVIILLIYISVHLGAKIPGCPRGYTGAGGLADHGDHADCTGGVHRYIDVHLFGEGHFYGNPTCKRLYKCQSYDPEGALGSLTACTLTYLGLLTGRVLAHYKSHAERLSRWAIFSFFLLLLAGALCGFSQNGGVIPVNKNLWSTSFAFVTAGGGIFGLAMCYILCDLLKWWRGTPFMYLGMNSILIYCGHAVLGGFFPFSYDTDSSSHEKQLMMNIIGTASWLVVAWYFHRIKFFVKV